MLSGIESVLIEDMSLVVRFAPASDRLVPASDRPALEMTSCAAGDSSTASGQDADTLTLTITYAHKRGQFSISSAQVDLYHMNISDLVAVAAMRNDLEYLVTSVCARWHQMFSFHVELEALRDRYALDWVPDDSTVRVLIGSGGATGPTVCLLHLQPGYPHTGRVTLQSISGQPPEGCMEKKDISVALPESASLTDWLHHLHVCLDKTSDKTVPVDR